MESRKQKLLKRHRRNKRIGLTFVVLVLSAFIDQRVIDLGPPWIALVLAFVFWIIHEAWFADHLFYSPRDSYRHDFPEGTWQSTTALEDDTLTLVDGELPPGTQTLVLECTIKATLLGYLLDPRVLIKAGSTEDRQDFERRVSGRRYLNLSGFEEDLRAGRLSVRGRFCRVIPGRLHAFANPDYAAKRLMIIAPHADDAELAAFGLYHRADEASIVTLTQGEIEARHYERLGLGREQAARLKGRLRTWNSLAVPLWGGVPMTRCIQLGYFCLRLREMREQPDVPFGSKESGELNIRSARAFNTLRLPGDADARPTWNNLVGDLVALLEHFRPEVIVLPHSQLDPHADHVHAAMALEEAITRSTWKPELQLLYANHLHDNDRWPMGPADNGVALPPAIEPLPSLPLWSPVLSAEMRLDKAMALTMQHDLQVPLPMKKRIRRFIQALLLGRRWPITGEDEFFRKAVRRHELFWVRRLDTPADD
ncbi:PIG-L deacetylase family protein [Pseudomonas matsuisoli]|nr:PIG-L family deacetylase [Pseudomonas matsuisoli]